jgi:choline dehydrogenase
VALARRVAQTRAFDAFRGAERWPGTNVTADSDVQAFVRATAETLYHPVGTCRMGAPADAVVDSALRVHGVDGLRVVDASVMPAIVTGHPNAAVIMIAERASVFIRDTEGASSGRATA